MQPLTERVESYVKNSEYFVNIIKNINLRPKDICASLDTISRYPNILAEEALDQRAKNEDLPAHIM